MAKHIIQLLSPNPKDTYYKDLQAFELAPQYELFVEIDHEQIVGGSLPIGNFEYFSQMGVFGYSRKGSGAVWTVFSLAKISPLQACYESFATVIELVLASEKPPVIKKKINEWVADSLGESTTKFPPLIQAVYNLMKGYKTTTLPTGDVGKLLFEFLYRDSSPLYAGGFRFKDDSAPKDADVDKETSDANTLWISDNDEIRVKLATEGSSYDTFNPGLYTALRSEDSVRKLLERDATMLNAARILVGTEDAVTFDINDDFPFVADDKETQALAKRTLGKQIADEDFFAESIGKAILGKMSKAKRRSKGMTAALSQVLKTPPSGGGSTELARLRKVVVRTVKEILKVSV